MIENYGSPDLEKIYSIPNLIDLFSSETIQQIQDYHESKDLLPQEECENLVKQFDSDFKNFLDEMSFDKKEADKKEAEKNAFTRLSKRFDEIKSNCTRETSKSKYLCKKDILNSVYKSIDPQKVKDISDMNVRREKAKEMFRFINFIREIDPSHPKAFPENIFGLKNVGLKDFEEIFDLDYAIEYTLEECQQSDETFMKELEHFCSYDSGYEDSDEDGKDDEDVAALVEMYKQCKHKCSKVNDLKADYYKPITYHEFYKGGVPLEYFITMYQLGLSSLVMAMEEKSRSIITPFLSPNIKKYLFLNFPRGDKPLIARDIYYYFKHKFYSSKLGAKRRSDQDLPELKLFKLTKNISAENDDTDENYRITKDLAYEDLRIPKKIPTIPSDVIKPLFFFMEEHDSFIPLLREFLFSPEDKEAKRVLAAFQDAKSAYLATYANEEYKPDLEKMTIPVSYLSCLIRRHFRIESERIWEDHVSQPIVSYDQNPIIRVVNSKLDVLIHRCSLITHLNKSLEQGILQDVFLILEDSLNKEVIQTDSNRKWGDEETRDRLFMLYCFAQACLPVDNKSSSVQRDRTFSKFLKIYKI